MSRLQSIENALLLIDQATFQELCDSQSTEKFWEKNGWKLSFHEYENTYIVFENEIRKIAIDIISLRNTSFIVEVFSRSKESNSGSDLSEFAAQHGLNYNGTRYVCNASAKNEIVEKLKSML